MTPLRPTPALFLLGISLTGCGSDTTSPGLDTSAGGTGHTTLQLEVVTIGATRDPTGYTVTLDDTTSRVARPADTLRFTALEPGTHRLELTGVALNCRPAVPRSSTIELTHGLNRASLRVACDSALSNVLVISGDLIGLEEPLVAVRPTDGAALGTLTRGPGALDRRAAVSPDGRYVALARMTINTSTYTIATMQVMTLRVADGSITPLAAPVPWIDRLAWTPDGQAVLATGDFPSGHGAYRIPAAGGPPVRLPLDGLGYDVTSCGDGQLLTTGVESIDRLSATGALLGRWSSGAIDDPQSPACTGDAGLVAFEARPGGRDISPYPSAVYLVRGADGVLEQLTPSGAQAQDPTLSPAGDRVAFTSLVGADWHTDVLYLAGPRKGQRYTVHRSGFEPVWAPDLDPEGAGGP